MTTVCGGWSGVVWTCGGRVVSKEDERKRLAGPVVEGRRSLRLFLLWEGFTNVVGVFGL